MKLSKLYLTEENPKYKTFYKGMTLNNFVKFKQHKIPGFLSDLEMALIYADPKTQGKSNEPRVIISTNIDINYIEDLRHEINDMCGSWQDNNNQKRDDLRKRIWWANSGGHGKRGIYCGKPVEYNIFLKANDMVDYYNQLNTNPELKKILDRNRHLSNNENASWQDFK